MGLINEKLPNSYNNVNNFVYICNMNKNLDILKGIHPGFFLAHELQRLKLNKRSFAASIQEHPQTIGSITKGHRRMNIGLAMKIENKLGLEDGFMMILQVFYDIDQEKKRQQNEKPDFSKFRPALFWDTEIGKIDWVKQKSSVIQRVNERGNNIEKEEITKFYSHSDSQIDSALTNA